MNGGAAPREQLISLPFLTPRELKCRQSPDLRMMMPTSATCQRDALRESRPSSTNIVELCRARAHHRCSGRRWRAQSVPDYSPGTMRASDRAQEQSCGSVYTHTLPI